MLMDSTRPRRGRGLGRRVIGGAAAFSLAAGLGLGTAGNAQANPAGWGDTPGTYTNYAFPADTGDLTSVTWSTTVTADPGFTSHTFWAHQFGFNKGNGAYVGMQDNGGEDQLFLFSVWDVTEARPGSDGSWCQDFGGEGTGESCRMHVPWKAGDTYAFTVAYEGDGWFGATIDNTTDKTSFKLGSIRTPATAMKTGGMVDWVEYYEWSMRRSTCVQQPYSAATFGLPVATTTNGGRVTGSISRLSNNGDCSNVDVAAVPGGSEQILGIGNSPRGAITGRSGNCLDIDGIDHTQLEWADDADLAANENQPATVQTCHQRTDQGWVHGADRTLRLVNNFCLTAAPDTTGSGRKNPVTITTCGTDPGPLKTWTYGGDGSIVNDGTGQCLYAPPGNETGHRVELRTCTGRSGEKWTAPSA